MVWVFFYHQRRSLFLHLSIFVLAKVHSEQKKTMSLIIVNNYFLKTCSKIRITDEYRKNMTRVASSQQFELMFQTVLY